MNETEKKPLTIYCNGLNVTLSPYDFIISINQNTMDSAEKIADIILSPEHAKVFSTILAHNVSEYESIFGVIPDVHPDRMNELAKAGKINVEGVSQ